jgi:chromosome segregation ATPase
MKLVTAVIFPIGLLLLGLPVQAQPPASDPNLRSAIRDAIQQARSLRKTQEAISAALEAKQAPRAMLTEQIALTEKILQSLQSSIDKIDEQYDSLSESRQSAVRDAWSTLKLFGVLFDYLKETAAKPDSAERDKDLISHATSTTRRAVQLDETLSLLDRPT